MPNHRSAAKRARQNEKRANRNQMLKTALKTAIRNYREALQKGEAEAIQNAFKKLIDYVVLT